MARARRLEPAEIVLERDERHRGHLADAPRTPVGRRATALGLAFQEAREILQVGGSPSRGIAGEPGDPVLDVGGVADLGHLAVGDQIDAGLDLAPDCLVDAGPDRLVEHRRVNRLLALDREQHVGHRC